MNAAYRVSAAAQTGLANGLDGSFRTMWRKSGTVEQRTYLATTAIRVSQD